MPAGRIRSIKPEFWTDLAIGRLSFGARLLFLASLNAADDEGLLQWDAAYLMRYAFPYDRTVNIDDVEQYMQELHTQSLVHTYTAGRNNDTYAWIVSFRKHQHPQRPQPAKHPLPTLNDSDLIHRIAEQENWTCATCHTHIDTADHSNPAILAQQEPRKLSTITVQHLNCTTTPTTTPTTDPTLFDKTNVVPLTPNQAPWQHSTPATPATPATPDSATTTAKPAKTPNPPIGNYGSIVATTDEQHQHDVLRICDHLNAQLSNTLTPSQIKQQQPKKWANVISMMIRADELNPDGIITLIDFATTDEFWRANIQSARSLRKNSSKIILKKEFNTYVTRNNRTHPRPNIPNPQTTTTNVTPPPSTTWNGTTTGTTRVSL